MAKKIKDDKKNQKLSSKNGELENTKNDKILEKELKEEARIYEDLEKLEKENKKLEKQLKEQEEILKNTQLQYISLKNEFDAFTNIIKKNEEKQKEEIFEKVILKVIPILELFINSYEHLPDEFKDHKWTEGLDIINKKINSFLKELNIEIIKTVGEDVDETKHEVLGMEEIKDKNLKNKIIKEIKKGYVLKKDGKEKVLIPAKVIVGI